MRSAISTAYDREGNRVVAGTFSQEIKIGDRTLKAAGGTDIFIAKLDRAGKVLWAERYGGEANEAITDLAIDPGNNLVVAGKTQGPLDLAGQTLQPQLRGDMQRSLFVAKLTADGKAIWLREVAVGNDSAVVDVAVAPDGRISTGVGLIGPLVIGGKPQVVAGRKPGAGRVEPGWTAQRSPHAVLRSHARLRAFTVRDGDGAQRILRLVRGTDLLARFVLLQQ